MDKGWCYVLTMLQNDVKLQKQTINLFRKLFKNCLGNLSENITLYNVHVFYLSEQISSVYSRIDLDA